jgi:hypothetical protein
MAIISGGQVIEGSSSRVLSTGAAPVAGTNEVQNIEITGSPTGGTYTLGFEGHRTSALDHDADATAVQTALRALAPIGSDGVTVTGDGSNATPFVVTFVGRLAKLAVPTITLVSNDLEGGTDPDVEITVATPGVTATLRGAAPGTLLYDTDGQDMYVNNGTAAEPVWEALALAE